MTIKDILSNKEVTVEKNVYGFLYILLLFSDINKLKPIDVINKMGEKYFEYILCGWGDLNEWKNNIIKEWEECILGKANTNNVEEHQCKEAKKKVYEIWDIIYDEKITTNKKYGEIIKEYFENH